MRILALVPEAFGGVGGIAQYNRDFLTAAAGSTVVSSIDVLPRLASESCDPFPAKLRQQRPIFNKFLYALVASISALRGGIDTIYCGHLYHGPVAAHLARFMNAKLVSQLHGTEIWTQLPSRLITPLKQSDLVLCVSRDTKIRYDVQAGEVDNSRILYNTVRQQFKPGDKILARARFNLSARTILLSAGRLDNRNGYKGHDRVINALPTLLRDGRDIQYLIAGAGPDQARLEELVTHRDLDKYVRFLGTVPLETLVDLYRAADLFVLPSTGEGFGIVFLEAMACGTPALGLHVGGAPEALCNGDLGWCVAESEFPTALKRALDVASSDPSILAAKVQARFGLPVFQQNVCSMFAELDADHSHLPRSGVTWLSRN